MASPENSLLIVALAVLGPLAVLLAILLYRRQREARNIRDIGDRLAAVAATGDLAERLSPHAAGSGAEDFAENADRLLERLQKDSTTHAEREQVYRRLTEAMHEGVAVDRDGIQLSNARFAEICGAANPAQRTCWERSCVGTARGRLRPTASRRSSARPTALDDGSNSRSSVRATKERRRCSCRSSR
jgi:hypothetical protein